MRSAASELLSGADKSASWEKAVPRSRGMVNHQSQVQLRLYPRQNASVISKPEEQSQPAGNLYDLLGAGGCDCSTGLEMTEAFCRGYKRNCT